MPDKQIVCNTCTKTFVFNEKEQAFFQTKGFLVDPKHCFECRKQRRAEKEAKASQSAAPTPSKTMREPEHAAERPAMSADEQRRRFGSKPRGGAGRGGRGSGSEARSPEFDDVWKKP